MRIVAVALFVVSALGACAVSQKNFPHATATADCHRLQECDKGSFEQDYTSMHDCVDTREASWQSIMDFVGGFCNYDDVAAGKCVESVRTVSCDDYNSGNFDASCNNLCDGQGS